MYSFETEVIVNDKNNLSFAIRCARICRGNMPLAAAQIRRGKRQRKKNFVVYYKCVHEYKINGTLHMSYTKNSEIANAQETQ